MMTSRSFETESPVRRGRARILMGYLLTVISVGLGGIVTAGLQVAGQSCDLVGFACLGWFVWGIVAGAALAAIVLIVLSLRLEMGGYFALITIGLLVMIVMFLPVVLSVLAPGVAAWITQRPR